MKLRQPQTQARRRLVIELLEDRLPLAITPDVLFFVSGRLTDGYTGTTRESFAFNNFSDGAFSYEKTHTNSTGNSSVDLSLTESRTAAGGARYEFSSDWDANFDLAGDLVKGGNGGSGNLEIWIRGSATQYHLEATGGALADSELIRSYDVRASADAASWRGVAGGASRDAHNNSAPTGASEFSYTVNGNSSASYYEAARGTTTPATIFGEPYRRVWVEGLGASVYGNTNNGSGNRVSGVAHATTSVKVWVREAPVEIVSLTVDSGIANPPADKFNGSTLVNAPTTLLPVTFTVSIEDAYVDPLTGTVLKHSTTDLSNLDVEWTFDIPRSGRKFSFGAEPPTFENGLVQFSHREIFPPEAYGDGAVVTARVVNRETGSSDSGSQPFFLVFQKTGDDDTDGIKNWFEYWASDSATSHGIVPNVHHASEASEKIQREHKDSLGVTVGDGTIYLFDSAATASWTVADFRFPPVIEAYANTILTKPLQGIDLVEMTLTHELVHRYLHTQALQDFPEQDPDHSDHDNIPDRLEQLVSEALGEHYDPNAIALVNPGCDDARNQVLSPQCPYTQAATIVFDPNLSLEKYQYFTSDEEMLARMVSIGLVSIPKIDAYVQKERAGFPNPDQDFANPGKNTDPAFLRQEITETGNEATVLRVVGDRRLDFKTLAVEIEVDVQKAGTFSIFSELDAQGRKLSLGAEFELSLGRQTISLPFNAKNLRIWRQDAPMTLDYVLVVGESSLSVVEGQYTTRAYHWSEFDSAGPAEFERDIPSQLVDDDGDGAIDRLVFRVNVDSQTATSAVEISGFAATADGISLGQVRATGVLQAGTNDFELSLDVAALRMQRVSGSVSLTGLSLEQLGERWDFIQAAAVTAPLTAMDYGLADADLELSVQDAAVDTNADGTADTLRTAITVNTRDAGFYTVWAVLSAADGTYLAETTATSWLEVGAEQLALDFSTAEIVARHIDGPYQISRLVVMDGSLQSVDAAPRALATSTRSWAEWIPDVIPPTSAVLPLPFAVTSANFLVTWSATDTAGGSVAYVDLYFSVDDGPLQTWLLGQTATQAVFSGDDGRDYTFYSVAVDRAGNRQVLSTTAGVLTRVNLVFPWHNQRLRSDINADGEVGVDDILWVIYLFYQRGNQDLSAPTASLRLFADVTGNNRIEVDDILFVVTDYNAQARQGLGESGESNSVSENTDAVEDQTSEILAQGIFGDLLPKKRTRF